jgi:hypothetical protein
VGDFQGHPFRGNQWTDSHAGGGSDATIVSRRDWTPSAEPRVKTYRATQLKSDDALLDQVMVAYGKNPGAFESDEFSGGSGDAYKQEGDLAAKLSDLHSRQDEKMRELGIFIPGSEDPRRFYMTDAPRISEGEIVEGRWRVLNPRGEEMASFQTKEEADRAAGANASLRVGSAPDFTVHDSRGNLVGYYGTREQAEKAEAQTRAAHPIMDPDDARGNMIAATRVINEVIAAVEENPTIHGYLKDTPLNINYQPRAQTEMKDGVPFTEGASITLQPYSQSGDELTLNVYRGTSSYPDVVAHEIGHVLVYAAMKDPGRNFAAVDMNKAIKEEGGVTNYADEYANGRFSASGKREYAGVTSAAHEQAAEVEKMYAHANRKDRAVSGEGQIDEIDYAHALATGSHDRLSTSIHGVIGLATGTRSGSFPKTAAAWLGIRNVSGPAPKDIRKWSDTDYKKAWKIDRIFALAYGRPDIGAYNEHSVKILRQKWAQQWGRD